MLDVEAQKALAARWAVEQVRDGMSVGIGSGSTAALAIQALAERVKQGLRINGVATSVASDDLARRLGIPMVDFFEIPALDLAFDGADEVDSHLNLIKGLGGALLHEKLVALAARELLIMVDESKPVGVLGERSPLPVEIVPFGWRRTKAAVEALGCRAELRQAGRVAFATDGGHYILDCRFGAIVDPAGLAARLKALTGVVEHGLFLGMSGRVAIGRADGSVEVRERQESHAD